MATKQTPKSCACQTCMQCKRSAGAKKIMKLEERAHRHQSNKALRTGKEDNIMPATRGSRIG